MGCLSSFEIGQAENPGFRGQYALNQNEYNAQYAKKRNQNVVIPLPDPKLFEFDPNFLKNCDNIEKRTYSDYEYEGQMKDGNKNGKGIMRWTTGKWKGDVYQGEFKDDLRNGKGI